MAVTLTARSIGLMVATAAAAGWLGASLTQPAPPAQSSTVSTPRRSAEPRPVPRADHLRELLSTPATPHRGRNPFVYGPRTSNVRDHQQHGDEAAAAAAAAPAMPVAPPQPVFRLSGIASDDEGGAVVLTAIVIDNGSMVFVKAGDKLSNGHSVVRVEEMSVTLIDSAGVTQTLRLP